MMIFRTTAGGGRVAEGKTPTGNFFVEWDADGKLIVERLELPMAGLGDAVAKVAQPIAKAIDASALAVGIKMNVSGCAGCKQRRSDWNELMPF